MVKRWIKLLLAKAGYGIYRLDAFKLIKARTPLAYHDFDQVRMEVLRRGEVELVLDIGANRGQFGSRLREAGYFGRLISLEPGTEAFGLLSTRAASDPRWLVFNLALGAEEAELTLNLSANRGESSSLLPMLPLHYESAPNTEYVGTEQVSVTSLSTFLTRHEVHERSIYLKLDVQGYELEALKGCSAGDLQRIVGVEAELTHQPLYAGQPLIDEVAGYLYDAGFYLVSQEPVFVRRQTAICLQSDAIFARRGLLDDASR